MVIGTKEQKWVQAYNPLLGGSVRLYASCQKTIFAVPYHAKEKHSNACEHITFGNQGRNLLIWNIRFDIIALCHAAS